MRIPEDALAPRGAAFAEPWHAQTLATAFALIRAGHLTASGWAEALGQALRAAEAAGQPDTEETYYLAALDALEQVTPLSAEALHKRKAQWAAAYHATPHGQPVKLGAGDPQRPG